MILESFQELVREHARASLPSPGEVRRLGPLPGGAPAGLAAALVEEGAPLVVVVAATPGAAETVTADLEALEPSASRAYFPQRETLPHEDRDPHVEIAAERAGALEALLRGRAKLLVTTARALAERTPVPVTGEGFELVLEEGRSVGRDALAERLASMGFDRVHTVTELGEFAVRGGILDLFPFGSEHPLRVELWGDEVASLRLFDLTSQRSVRELERFEVLPVDLEAGEASGEGDRRCLLELLPDEALVLDLTADGDERRRRLWEETAGARRDRRAGRSAEELVLPPAEAASRLEGLARLAGAGDEGVGGAAPDTDVLDLGLEPPPAVDRDMSVLVDEAATRLDRGERVLLLCDNRGQMERLEEILEERGGAALARDVTLGLGSLSGGFRIPGQPPLTVFTDHEVFRRSHRLRRSYRTRASVSHDALASLEPGDYLVHLDHGIGLFRGLERVEIGGETVETLKIEYADGEVLRVPHYRVDLVEPWSATGGDGAEPPRVHKLGGKRWRRLKEKTVDSIQETAAELLELYAHRQVVDGHAFSGETRWQKEFESAFLYEETPDQLAAWEEVRADMEEPHPMDRLVCGDVGYGKTEVAMRAAFKAIQDGKQVAVLAPTTVLVEQHLHTFQERMAGFPVTIRALSRFQSEAQQRETLRELEVGALDVVVGTHRLLSEDVTFDELGLLVVDEEQRFGVRQKERLKDYKRSVDVLTLTATPIPRTLQLALGGLRDLSVIETAPRDRMPVITHVLSWSDVVLRDAMRRELDRGGQVFFVHDRVQTIDALAARVRRLVPEAHVAVAHGQMPERELEHTMDALMEGEVDVLVSTSIIENGLDVATANTMVVHRADRFGLSQLYQLRGRVGRSHHRAYCYLLVPEDVTPEAEERLKILEHHTELGAGYQVALKDLELRGAGNLLGENQSGFAQAVGFETYRRLLEKTVSRMKGEDEASTEPPRVSLDGEAYLPDDYIGDDEQKMSLYRRIAKLESRAEVEEMRDELRDRFGPLPSSAERLLASTELSILGSALDAEWIRVSDGSGRIHFRADATPRMKLLRDAFLDRQLEVEVRRTQPLSLVLKQGGVRPVLATLVEALAVLATTEEAGAAA